MGWTYLVDRGGTFTDVVARAPDGSLHVRKLLSSTDAYEDATALAVSAGVVDELRIGTTLATNALLERKGERVLLLTTRGFGDLLEIGNQARPEIFALQIVKPSLLHAAVVEIDERILADGSVRRAPEAGAIRAALGGWEHVAVLFLNSYRNPAHELLVERIAGEMGIPHVTLSHRAAAEIGAVARGDTTVADAYLTPRLRASVARAAVPGARVLCMQSSGGLTDASHFSGKDAILSGPAGGVVATGHVARQAGFGKVIGLDMGGTSTDVCRCDGGLERVYETVTAGVRIRAPMLDIVTVAAGGGSILSHADGRYGVGPESAGADPGPACYGRGGPATVTDANVVLGRIRPEWFPHMRLDVDAAHNSLAAFGEPRQAAEGFLAVAVANMAAAIRRISVARGHDVREYALCCFGGAGGQHACALARSLGMSHVLLHPLAGVLSAYGLGLADVTHHEVAPVLDPDGEPLFPEQRAARALAEQGFTDVTLVRSVDARYVGVEGTLSVPWSPDWRDSFEQSHRALFGFVKDGHPIELVAARVEAVGRTPRIEQAPEAVRPHRPEPAARHEGLPIHRRVDLRPGAALEGPALVVEDHATTWLEPGWEARVDGHRNLVLQDLGAPSRPPRPPSAPARGGRAPDPVTLEVMSNLFMSLAEQMGEHLRRVAHSTNIKERLDYSCALFDPRGGLIANAPHIPVHLGAMGETVRALLEDVELRPGDAWLTNDPYRGGSHLPDLTVISPVFRDGELAFLVANRGHHADVGGIAPGSMPPDSRTLADEGALFSNVPLVRDGRMAEAQVTATFEQAGTRDIPDRLSDLTAQIACNVEGARRLDELCDRFGLPFVQLWMQHVQDNAADVMRDVVRELEGGSFEDGLDDGSRIRVSIEVRDGRARIDFTGTSPQQAGNRNAPRAVTVAAVLYVFRTLARRPIPLNAGCLQPLDIVIPPGSLLDPRPPAAVVGGNVETSQRVVDVLYGALGKLAASQGTMNNVTFGDDAFGYYETVCGGAGAGLGFDGASAVHTHMTNTRITDPEVLEQRYPVVVRRFAVRRGSGGQGVWRGGDGVVRELEFLRPLSVSVLAERRRTDPFGLRAGPGARGETRATSRSLTLLTPGGGGYTPGAEEWSTMPAVMARRLFREDRWRGPTAGVATDRMHAHVVVVPADRAEEVALDLGHRALLHRSQPGQNLVSGPLGEIDLSRDLPLFARRAASVAAAPGRVLERGPNLAFGPDDVALLIAATSPDEPAPAVDVVHWSGADGRLLVTDLPRSPA